MNLDRRALGWTLAILVAAGTVAAVRLALWARDVGEALETRN